MAGAVRYDIEHVSRYRYTRRVRQCTMLLCLEPVGDGRQRLLRFEIEVRPAGGLSREIDSFGNPRHVLDVHRAHHVLEIATRCTVESTPPKAPPTRLGGDAWREVRAHADSFANWDFTRPSPLTRSSPGLDAFIERHRIRRGLDPLESLLRLCDTLHRRLHYIPGATSAESPVDHVIETDRGVCQDYAHVMIAIARSWGIPARYVSGYLHVTGKAGEHSPDNATHAWVECRLPNLGWIGFDPTNQGLAGPGHVRIAAGRDYRDVSPTRGVIRGGGESHLEVTVEVRAETDPTLPSVSDRAILFQVKPRRSGARTTTSTRTRGRWTFRPNGTTEP